MRRWAVVALPLALLTACGGDSPSAEPRVDASAHRAFFLWAGVQPQPVLDRAESVYVLAGEVQNGGPAEILWLRAPPRIGHAQLWLTIRTERLDWPPRLAAELARAMRQWQAAGNRVAGLQIDFDACTRGLGGYAAFLRGLRKALPVNTKLSVTGLMDWTAHADPAALQDLGEVADEIVIQTYQGRDTVPAYRQYLPALRRLPLPYRIGLVQGGVWQAPAGLERDPRFRGYVVFLLNPEPPAADRPPLPQ